MSGNGHDHGSANCREIFARLSEYVDGELPRGLCQSVERHFDDCPPCQDFLESLRRTIAWIEQAETPPLPEDLRRAIREARRSLPVDGDDGSGAVGGD